MKTLLAVVGATVMPLAAIAADVVLKGSWVGTGRDRVEVLAIVPSALATALWITCDTDIPANYGYGDTEAHYDDGVTAPDHVTGPDRYKFSSARGMSFANTTHVWTNLFDGCHAFTFVFKAARPTASGENGGVLCGDAATGAGGMVYGHPMVRFMQSGMDMYSYVAEYPDDAFTNVLEWTITYDGSRAPSGVHMWTNESEVALTSGGTVSAPVEFTGAHTQLDVGKDLSGNWTCTLTYLYLLVFDTALSSEAAFAVHDSLTGR